MGEDEYLYNAWIIIDPDISHDESSIALDGPREMKSESPLNFASTVMKWMDSLQAKWPVEEMAAWIERCSTGEVVIFNYDIAVALDHLDEAKLRGIDLDDSIFQEQYEWGLTRAMNAIASGYTPVNGFSVRI